MRGPGVLLASVLALVLLARPVAAADASVAPLAVRVVVVTTFEIGRDSGDLPGEFQRWVERLPLRTTLAFPAGYHHLRYDAVHHVLGMVTGEGAERAAASIMALGLDPRFDLRRAYWLLAGIAGIDPNVAAVGSAAWAEWVVNGDLAYELDARDMPPDWSTGIVPFGRAAPFAEPAPALDSIHGAAAFHLDPGLVAWAYRLTAHTALPESAALRAARAAATRFPNAQRPPVVMRGDTLAADRYWIGPAMNAWAERWVSYWTGGRGRFVTTAEEDAGVLQALTFLGHAGRVDRRRVLVLRTASDLAVPGDGAPTASILTHNATARTLPPGFVAAVEAAYRVGSRVVLELATHWDRYRDALPSAAQRP